MKESHEWQRPQPSEWVLSSVREMQRGTVTPSGGEDMSNSQSCELEHPEKAENFPRRPEVRARALFLIQSPHQTPGRPLDAGWGPNLHCSPAVDAASPQLRPSGVELGDWFLPGVGNGLNAQEGTNVS